MPLNYSVSILVFNCRLDSLDYQIFPSHLPVSLGLLQDPWTMAALALMKAVEVQRKEGRGPERSESSRRKL